LGRLSPFSAKVRKTRFMRLIRSSIVNSSNVTYPAECYLPKCRGEEVRVVAQVAQPQAQHLSRDFHPLSNPDFAIQHRLLLSHASIHRQLHRISHIQGILYKSGWSHKSCNFNCDFTILRKMWSTPSSPSRALIHYQLIEYHLSRQVLCMSIPRRRSQDSCASCATLAQHFKHDFTILRKMWLTLSSPSHSLIHCQCIRYYLAKKYHLLKCRWEEVRMVAQVAQPAQYSWQLFLLPTCWIVFWYGISRWCRWL